MKKDKENKKKQLVQDKILSKNNAEKLREDIKDKKSLPVTAIGNKKLLSKIVDKGLLPVTEDKKPSKIVGKGLPLVTRDKK